MAKTEILHTVPVKLPAGRGYEIEIGVGNSCAIARAVSEISGPAQVFVVTDKNVARLHLEKVMLGLKGKNIQAHNEILHAGERIKNLASYRKLLERITEFDDARDLVVIALGGGVIGDLAGFVAATYKRGTKFIQVPTTLLACVDSSVGGKTAVDLPAGKNLVGAFHQPSKVVIDLELLKTLPPRELRAGYAEVMKTALIFDKKFFAYLEGHGSEILRSSPEPTAHAVKRCCELKAAVVARDERDTLGHRALLNLGHTFGHAAEAALGYSRVRHGEAVAAGMVCAAELSVLRGMLSEKALLRIESHVQAAGLPVKFAGTSPDELLQYMSRDKKFAQGENRFVLFEEIGRAALVKNIPRAQIAAVLKKMIQ